MKTQTSQLRTILFVGAAAIAVLALIGFAANRDNGLETVGGGAFEDNAVSPDGGGNLLGDIDAALGRAPLPSVGQEARKDAPGSSSAGAPPIASEGATRGSSGVAPDQAAPGTSSSLIDDRKIVQTASMRLEVKEVGASFEEVGRVATSVGGFVASSSFSNQGDSQVASLTIRVPSTRYQAVLADLRGLGVKVLNEDSRSTDVTAEYTDLNARLRNLEATETQLLQLLGRATTISEILQVQDRLNSIRTEIDQVKGRMALLDKLTDLATIAVHLVPVAGGAGDDGGRIGQEIARAWDASIEFLTDIAAGAVHVVVFAWWVPVVGIPLLLIGRSLLRNRPRPIESVD